MDKTLRNKIKQSGRQSLTPDERQAAVRAGVIQSTEDERWPTTGSEESFCKLSSEQMVQAGFDLDDATMAEFEAYRDKCDEESGEYGNSMDEINREPMVVMIDAMGSTFYDFQMNDRVLVHSEGHVLEVRSGESILDWDELPEEYIVLKVVEKKEKVRGG